MKIITLAGIEPGPSACKADEITATPWCLGNFILNDDILTLPHSICCELMPNRSLIMKVITPPGIKPGTFCV